MAKLAVPATAEGMQKLEIPVTLMEDVDTAECLVRTIWLALASPNFDADDTQHVSNVLYFAIDKLERLSAATRQINDQEIAIEVHKLKGARIVKPTTTAAGGTAMPTENTMEQLALLLRSGDTQGALALAESLHKEEPAARRPTESVAHARHPKLKINDVEDILATVGHLNDAIFMAVTGLDDMDCTNAIQSLNDEIKKRLLVADDMLMEIGGELA